MNFYQRLVVFILGLAYITGFVLTCVFAGFDGSLDYIMITMLTFVGLVVSAWAVVAAWGSITWLITGKAFGEIRPDKEAADGR